MDINKLIKNIMLKWFKNQALSLPIIIIVAALAMFWMDATGVNFLSALLSLVIIAYLFYLKDNPEPKVLTFVDTPEYFKLPEYKTAQASGMDVYYVKDARIEINPGDRALIPTGLFVDIPEGYELQARPRSGLAWNDGITVLNSPGTIDSKINFIN